MGCDYSKENKVYSLSCCFCKKPRNASYWIAAVGLVYGGFAMCFDWIQAHMHEEPCDYCLDYHLNKKLSYASAIIDSVQWCTNILLIIGLRRNWKILLLAWLTWAVVYIGMQLVWVFITLPYTPTLRGFTSTFHSIWAVHYFIVVKTQYTMMALTFDPPEEPPKLVPLNTPTRRRHKRQKKRADMNNTSPIRTLLGACVKLREEQLKRTIAALQHPELFDEEELQQLRQSVFSRREELLRRGRENQGAQLNDCADNTSNLRSQDTSHSTPDGSSKSLLQEGRKMTGDEGAAMELDEWKERNQAGYIVMDMERENASKSATNPFDDNFCDVPIPEKTELLDSQNGECTIVIDASAHGSSDGGKSSPDIKTAPENLHRRRMSYKIATNNKGVDEDSEFVFL